MKNLEYFKTKKDTKRFRKNQKVWVSRRFGNFIEIFHKWRGNGRYVCSTLCTWNKYGQNLIGEIKEILVTDSFYNFVVSRNGKDKQFLE